MIVRVFWDSQSNNERGTTNTGPPGGGESVETTNPMSVRLHVPLMICLKCAGFLAIVGLLILQQIQYRRDGWQTACDYQFKVWSTIDLSVHGLDHLLHLVNAISQSMNRSSPPFLLPLVMWLWVLLELVFRIAWFIWGAVILFLQDGVFDMDTCPLRAWFWTIGLWSWQALAFAFPCLFIILLVPCVMLWLVAFRGPLDNHANETPPDVLAKLRRLPYNELITEGFEDLDNPEIPSDETPLNRSPSTGPGATLLNAFPDVMGVTHLLSRFNSRGLTNTPREASGLNESVCAICCDTYEDQEIVIQLPCDQRHFFHDKCLEQWLLRNRNCPMCRRNIVDLIATRDLP